MTFTENIYYDRNIRNTTKRVNLYQSIYFSKFNFFYFIGSTLHRSRRKLVLAG